MRTTGVGSDTGGSWGGSCPRWGRAASHGGQNRSRLRMWKRWDEGEDDLKSRVYRLSGRVFKSLGV